LTKITHDNAKLPNRDLNTTAKIFHDFLHSIIILLFDCTFKFSGIICK